MRGPRDHRGNAVTLALPRRLRASGLDVRELGVPGVGIKPGGKGWNVRFHWTFAVWALIYVGVGVPVAIAFVRAGAPAWSLGLFMAIGIAAGYVSPVGRWWWNAVGPGYIDRIVQAGACAGCGFELERLRPEDDGCVVCPECGAAWKRSG